MRARKGFFALAAFALAIAATAGAAAQPVSTTPVSADISPLQGANAPLVAGWNEVVVRVTNGGGKPERGRIEVSSHAPFGSLREYMSTAPYAVAAGATIHVRVPAVVVQYTDLNVRVLDEAGIELASRRFSAAPPNDNVFLLDVNEPSLLRAALHELPIAPTFTPALGRAHGSGPQLLLGSPRVDPATGDFLLPDRPTLFGGADAVLLRSDVLARLGGVELDALSGYVLSGGTLAVALTRPEDLRSAPLLAFAGGAVTQGPVSAATLRDLVLAMPASGSSSAKTLPSARNAGDELGTMLAGYGGGNLHPSPYGSTATYGLGEVHLLAFDPTKKPAVDDPWAQVRVVDLARRAHDRRASIVFPPGGDDQDRDVNRVRQILDPNESSQWGIAAAALLLCIYAVLAGPLNFSLAAKKGHPLRALRWLPIFSIAAFLMVVGVGMIAKGITGRARHLSLIEAGAGMPRATVRRWRGFFASSARELTVHTSSASGVVRSAVVSGTDTDGGDRLLVDRDGARLVNVAALPWQTVVVREDAVTGLGEGVSILKDGADVVVKSRAGADLRAVVLKLPGASAPLYFSRIKDGERVLASAGRPLDALPDERAWVTALASSGASSHAGSLSLHPLEPHLLPRCFDKDADGIRAAFIALSAAAGDAVDWFPEDVPVLLGQLDGGEGHTRDGGLRLESDRVLVRVVGWGGRP